MVIQHFDCVRSMEIIHVENKKEIENMRVFWLYLGNVKDAYNLFVRRFGYLPSKAYITKNGAVYMPIKEK